ncbi:MAG: response regulator [Porticoccaceae bacterium]|nr:response regulator [Gammaproteobacteria bacterium]
MNVNAKLGHTPIKILVIDDHDVVRMGICSLIALTPGVEVIGQGSSGEQALLLTRELKPDIVFMDIRMPGIGGLEATRRLMLANPGLKVIVVSVFADDTYPAQLLKAGAAGYITKQADREEIQRALQTVIEDGIYVSPAIAQLMVVKGLKPDQQSSPLATLSRRELQIAQMIGSGHRANEVAAVLNISPKTINTYKYRIYDKLGVGNDVELALATVKYGLIDPNDVI